MAAMEKTRERQNVASRDSANHLQQTAQKSAQEGVQAMKSANAGWQQQAGQRQDRQAQALSARLENKGNELANHQQQRVAPANAASGASADRENGAERDVFNQSARSQQESLTKVDQLEREVLTQQATRLVAMETRQQNERATPGLSADARNAMEAKQRQETELIAARSIAEIRALDEHRSLTNARVSQEQAGMQKALYQAAPADKRLEQAKQVVDDQARAQKVLDDRARQQLSEVAQAYERQVEGLNSPTARYGDLERHRDQGRSLREQQRRVSEHEHILARINLVLQSIDPKNGMSQYDDKAYRNSATVTIPRDMALEKTRDDLELRDRLKEAARLETYDKKLLADLSVQAAIDRTIAARDRTIQQRLAENRGVEDLKAITDEVIASAAHYQQSEMFAIDRTQNDSVENTTDAELDEQLSRWREERAD
jgi:hypothetical protein